MSKGPKKPKPRNPSGRAPLSEKQRKTLSRGAWKKGQSGNPSGRTAEEVRTVAQAAQMCRKLVTSPEAIEEIKRLLFLRSKPRVQIEVIKILLERGFGAPLQAIVLRQMGALDDGRPEQGDGALAPEFIDPGSDAAFARATDVLKKLRDMGVVSAAPTAEPVVIEPPAAPAEPDVTRESAPGPRVFEPLKVVPMLRGPERFGAGRFEIITDEDRKKFE
jgi:hypothetical protein